MTASDAYNIDTYFRAVSDGERAAFPHSAVRVGSLAPPFSLPTVDGGTIALEDLLGPGHVVLVFGCLTAPPALAQLPALEALHRTYGGRGFSLLYVYTREIHPGEHLPPHRSMEQKVEQARRMRDHGRVTFPVAVDDLQGTVHNAYGGLPSMAVVVHRNGALVYRGSWTLANVIRDVLEDLLRRDRALEADAGGRLVYHEWISYMEPEAADVWNMIDLAGPKARADIEATGNHPWLRRSGPPTGPF